METICNVCGNEMEHHPCSGALTCFLHGNPDSRHISEQEIAKKYQV